MDILINKFNEDNKNLTLDQNSIFFGLNMDKLTAKEIDNLIDNYDNMTDEEKKFFDNFLNMDTINDIGQNLIRQEEEKINSLKTEEDFIEYFNGVIKDKKGKGKLLEAKHYEDVIKQIECSHTLKNIKEFIEKKPNFIQMVREIDINKIEKELSRCDRRLYRNRNKFESVRNLRCKIVYILNKQNKQQFQSNEILLFNNFLVCLINFMSMKTNDVFWSKFFFNINKLYFAIKKENNELSEAENKLKGIETLTVDEILLNNLLEVVNLVR